MDTLFVILAIIFLAFVVYYIKDSKMTVCNIIGHKYFGTLLIDASNDRSTLTYRCKRCGKYMEESKCLKTRKSTSMY